MRELLQTWIINSVSSKLYLLIRTNIPSDYARYSMYVIVEDILRIASQSNFIVNLSNIDMVFFPEKKNHFHHEG
jgi:hypothetical protein